MTRLFEDDTSLSDSSSDLGGIKHVLNDDLSQLSAWAKKWLITFNPLKDRSHAYIKYLFRS